jgi:large subunit ribosomal protein L29
MPVGSPELTLENLDSLNNENLVSELKKAKAEMFNLRFQKATGQLETHGRILAVRKDIARLETFLRERELGIRTEPVAPVVESKSGKSSKAKAKDSDGADTDSKTGAKETDTNKTDTGSTDNKSADSSETGEDSTSTETKKGLLSRLRRPKSDTPQGQPTGGGRSDKLKSSQGNLPGKFTRQKKG